MHRCWEGAEAGLYHETAPMRNRLLMRSPRLQRLQEEFDTLQRPQDYVILFPYKYCDGFFIIVRRWGL